VLKWAWNRFSRFVGGKVGLENFCGRFMGVRVGVASFLGQSIGIDENNTLFRSIDRY